MSTQSATNTVEGPTKLISDAASFAKRLKELSETINQKSTRNPISEYDWGTQMKSVNSNQQRNYRGMALNQPDQSSIRMQILQANKARA